jgi:16S rRNA G527 N7-methylase RsmG
MKTPSFKALYEGKLKAVYQSAFASNAMTETIENYAALIHSVNDEHNLVEIEAYDQSVEKVLTFIEQRMEYLRTVEVLSK